MNVKSAKKPQRRIDTNYLQRFHLQSYGSDNLYPQNLMAIIGASGTAQLCLSRYEKFVEGYGFNDERLSEMVINREGLTMDDLLHQIAGDLTRFRGFSLHVNYNVLGQISEVNFIPFEQCRLEETDDTGNVAYILTHCDWRGDRTRNGKKQLVTEKNIERFNVFNPTPEVVLKQIENAGGIDSYKGQIFWLSMDGRTQYPTPIYDSVITEISTDEGLGNIKYRNVRNNFLVACMLVAKKGAPRINEDGEEEDRQMIADEDLKEFQGDTKGSKILYVELENDEDEPKVVPFPTRNFDKEFTTTDESVIERIYSQFHQELFYSIRIGKLGFSGDVMRDAYEYYAGEVTTEQRFIERALMKVFANWNEANMPQDFSIRPMKYISAENNDKSNGE
ncbi:MAG: hypothetical protein PUG96_02430 [Prevotellaceae bacterium]|nr:hypothetical protein [Prevotella sp.]MDD7272809.1 hypothetical protein [Prevotellaceae bacterium]